MTAAMMNMLKSNNMALEKLIPAKVMQFDRATNMATIQPMIMIKDNSSNSHMRWQLGDIPVLSLGGGGFHISFPLKQGDLGWILAPDRDISLFLQTLEAAPINTHRNHKFEDAWFIPDVFRQYTINSADSGAMVIQSVDGSTRISISNGVINITAPSSVKVDTPKATFTKDVEIQGNLAVDQNAVVTGMTSVNGGFNATGGGNKTCTLPQLTTINGITVANHGHTQQNNGSGRTADGMIT
jgi:hypothetical protein